MKSLFTLDPISLTDLYAFIQSGKTLELDETCQLAIKTNRQYLEDRMNKSSEPLYGINTGFGSLYNQQISKDQLQKLQENLVVSHACGVGQEISGDLTKLMLLAKVRSLSLGYSGIRLETVQRLIDFYNADLLPVVYQQGSLGASGDLAPLAHLSLPLLGKGEVYLQGKKMQAKKALAILKMEPIVLESKEGLALLNGTQFMLAHGLKVVERSKNLCFWADLISAISFEAFNGNISAFHPLIHKVRGHRGQGETAENIRSFLKDSEHLSYKEIELQDPYSFRCIPQVHGGTKDILNYVTTVIETEFNSVTDNPLVFDKEDLILSGGNFHGQILALGFDSLSLAMAELGSISERRTFKLLSGVRGLPEFLVNKPGLNSGLMIPQYTAASLVSQNKQLCTPCCVDTIDSSNGQEDHVSMGANSAIKLMRILDNLQLVLSIEMLCACQGFEFRRPRKSSKMVERVFKAYRKIVPFIDSDRVYQKDINNTSKFLSTHNIKDFS